MKRYAYEVNVGLYQHGYKTPRYEWAKDQFGESNFQTQIIEENIIYYFEKEKDAMLFALKWSGV